jgi:hypothetical protein
MMDVPTNTSPPPHEIQHDRLELMLGQLAVGHGQPRLGHAFPQGVGGPLDVPHVVVHVEDLALARQLAAHRLGHHLAVPRQDLRRDRQAVAGGRVDDRDLADAREGHVQRARDGRRGQGQDVHVLLDGLELLLLGHPEPVFLVHDEQSQVGEAHVLGQEPMRPDEDVDLASAASRRISSCSDFLLEPREGRTFTGQSAYRSEKVW